MKALLMTAIVLFSAQTEALAADDICQVKMKNYASYTVAQIEGIPVQKVRFVKYVGQPFMSEAVGNNSISADLEIAWKVGNKTKKRTISVHAQQIGTSDDCEDFGRS